MNVRELIELLQQVDPTGELPVVVDGYEDGMDDLKDVQLIRIGEQVRHGPDEGWYDRVDHYGPESVREPFDAVYLPR